MLSTRERFFTSVFIVFFVAVLARHLVLSAHEKTKDLQRLSPPMILTPGLFMGQMTPGENAFDRDIRTAWIEGIPPIFSVPFPKRNHPAIPETGSLYLLAELGFTHFPANPPLENRPRELYIWSGNQKSREDFLAYARPRKVRILFFRQQMVDVDREFRLPELPELWGSESVELPDRAGRIRIPLDFLKDPGPSSGFPDNVSRVWIRLEILSLYPGADFPDTVAISEVDYRGPHADHPSVLPGEPVPVGGTK